VQGRVERSGRDLQHLAGDLQDALGDGEAVLRLERQRPEDEEIQRALR
jgi:hypothetical protein